MELKKQLKLISMFFLLCLILGFGYLFSQNKKTSLPPAVENSQFSVVPKSNSTLVPTYAPTMGPPDAPVTIVEFLDPECEACSAMNPIVKKIMKEYDGKIRLVVRYMPFHQNSKFAANILEGARIEGKYWEALNIMFKDQSIWASHHDPKPELLFEILKPLGLNLEKIKKDAELGLYNQIIEKDFLEGKNLGVNKTPTFFVNGNELMEIGYEPLKAAIDVFLKN